MTSVEIGSAARLEDQTDRYWWSYGRDQGEAPDDLVPEEAGARLHRVADPSVAESGIRYQRCGGGRRVIRRRKGGD